MRKFFIAIMFAFVAIVLVTMTGCSKQPTITVTNQTQAPQYAYQISHVSGTWDTYDCYIVEFWGGTAEQRQVITTTPYYRKYAVRYDFQVSAAIDNDIERWQRMMKKQQP